MNNTFIHTVTLYNRYEDRSTETTVTKWNRTVLTGCYFGMVSGQKLSDLNVSAQNTFVCRIPKTLAHTAEYRGDGDAFTLSPGDIIIKGDVPDEIADVKGQRASDLLRKYQGKAFTVEAVSVNDVLPLARHIRASGV